MSTKVSFKMRAHLASLGRKGGKARAEIVSPERRKEIARQGALAKWAKKRGAA